MSLEDASGLRCGTCKELAMILARQAIDAGAEEVDLCMTVTGDMEEHLFCRIDGQIRDPMQESGGPVRVVGEFIVVKVWPVSPVR